MQETSIAHFGKEWEPGTQTKRALIYGIVLGDKSSSHLELWRDILSQVVLCTSNFRNFPVRAYLPLYELRFLSRCFGSTAKNPSLKLFHGAFSWFFSGYYSPRYIFPFSFTFLFFFLSIPPSVLLCWAPLTTLKHSTSLSAIFVYIRVPPNNPLTVRAPSLGPRPSLFSEVSYRPFAQGRHFTSMNRILQGFAFLCKLGLLLFKPHWDYQI